MNLSQITTRLKTRFPVVRESVAAHPQVASVLVLLYARHGQAHVLMTKRADDLPLHPGEISFPGGVIEPQDDDLLATALRETREEIGLEVSVSAVVACLAPVNTLTGYTVTPYVALLNDPPRCAPSDAEVEEVLEIPLAPLWVSREPDPRFPPEEGRVVYRFDHHRIWGASAVILQQIESLRLL